VQQASGKISTGLSSVDAATNFNVYPNPFMDNVIAEFSLTESSQVSFEVFNTLGKLIYSENQSYSVGNHSINWQASTDLAKGVYWIRIETTNEVFKAKLVKE